MELSKKTEIQSRRLLSLDTLRGFLIFYMTLVHPLVFRVFEQERARIQILWDKTPLIGMILIFP